MANENQTGKRQQSSEMAQTASPSAQQGAGPGSGRTSSQTTTTQDPSNRSQASEPSGSALQTRRESSPSLYSGYGGGPFSVMRRISEEMDRLFDNFGLGRGLWPTQQHGQRAMSGHGGESTALWSPHIEVREREGKLVISADLPGIKKEDVSVEVRDDAVVIQGYRHQETSDKERGYSERSYGSFYRTIALPEGSNADAASATFRDGVLKIEIDAPQAQSKSRTLEIKDAVPESGRP